MITDLNEREQELIELSQSLMNRTHKLSAAAIDAEFIFRFEPNFRNQVKRLRAAMRGYFDLPGDGPLLVDVGAKWSVHLEDNLGLSIRFVNGKPSIEGYRPFDKSLIEQQIKAHMAGDNEEYDRIDREIFVEARFIQRILQGIKQLSEMYQLVPHRSERDQYTPIEIRTFRQRIMNWIIFGHYPPQFLWEITRLSESKEAHDGARSIRLFQWVTVKWIPREDGGKTRVEQKPKRGKRIETETRIRTWAIYFLSKRGGGKMTVNDAVELWNKITGQLHTSSNYYSELKRLFDKPSTK